jgi:drug/metabolite transporter (DMT)-like permease
MGVALAYAVCAVVWGTTWFAIRLSIAPGAYPTYLAAALRFTLACALLWVVVGLGLARPVPRGRRALLGLVLAGMLNGLSYALVYAGEQSISGGLAAVLFATMPLFTAILAVLTGVERPRRLQVMAALAGLAGICIVFADRMAVSSDQGVGLVLLLAAVAASSAYSVVLKRATAGIHPLAATAVFLLVTTLCIWLLVPLAPARAVPWPPPLVPTAAIVYLAVAGTVLAFACYIYLLGRVSLMTTTSLVFIQPLVALLVDGLWETRVRLSPASHAGIAVTLGGVLLGLLGRFGPGVVRRRAARTGGS